MELYDNMLCAGYADLEGIISYDAISIGVDRNSAAIDREDTGFVGIHVKASYAARCIPWHLFVVRELCIFGACSIVRGI